MKLNNVKHIGIVGTGMIGSSLAVLFTGNGYKTTLLAVDENCVKSCKKKYDDFYKDLVKNNLVKPEQVAICEKYLNFTYDYDDLKDVDIVIECVVEIVDVKHGILGKIEKSCKNLQAIVSTTSALSANDLVKGLEHYADKFMVAHPFNPPHVVPFVEVVKTADTSEAAVEFVIELFSAVGRKIVVLKKDVPGFIANRLQHALFREALYIVENGIASPKDVDIAAMYSFMPRYTSIGLFDHMDYSGLDLNKNIEEYLFSSLSNAAGAPDLVKDKVAAGNLGAKTGKGIYDWSKVDMNEFREKTSAPYLRFFDWDLPEK